MGLGFLIGGTRAQFMELLSSEGLRGRKSKLPIGFGGRRMSLAENMVSAINGGRTRKKKVIFSSSPWRGL